MLAFETDVDRLAEVDLRDDVGDRSSGDEQRQPDTQGALHLASARVNSPQRGEDVLYVVVGVRRRCRQRQQLGARTLCNRQRRLVGGASRSR